MQKDQYAVSLQRESEKTQQPEFAGAFGYRVNITEDRELEIIGEGSPSTKYPLVDGDRITIRVLTIDEKVEIAST